MDELGELVERSGRGDEAAFGELVRRTERLVAGVVGRLLGDVHEAEEVVQEIYVDAYRILPRWEPGARFTTWLHRAATRAALERRRARGRDGGRIEGVRAGPAPAGQTDPAAGLEDRELGRAVREAVDALPEGQRVTFVLRHYQDLPLARIAEIRGVALGTVKAQLSQALGNLRRSLGGVRP